MRYSIENKKAIIEEYEKSGLNKNEYSQQKGIGQATLNRWLKAEETKFVKVKTENIGIKTRKNTSEIQITYKEFKIFASTKVSEELLCRVLKSVVKTC